MLYFSGSVNGLRLGAPVTCRRGGRFGSSIIRISLQPDQSVQADSSRRRTRSAADHQCRRQRDYPEQPAEYQSALDAGLRAQLQTESLSPECCLCRRIISQVLRPPLSSNRAPESSNTARFQSSRRRPRRRDWRSPRCSPSWQRPYLAGLVDSARETIFGCTNWSPRRT